ncbi:MAG TPA: peptidoglycan-binding protein [Propionicimonas sp.]|nr:peptidoglycan-binding protein [Propionicimonas sp.]
MQRIIRLISAVVGMALVGGLSLTAAPSASAVTSSAKLSFISQLVSSAQAAQSAYGVPASVSIAQAAVNSNWGTDTMAKSARNYFDVRCMAVLSAAGFAKVANAQVGKRYILGAEAAVTNTNPSAFDCSELVQWVYGRSGNPITDLAAAQYDVTKPVKGSPKPGDLVFLRNNPARSNGIGHVAVVTKKLKNGDWRVIEARGRAYGVVRTTLSYWKTRSYYAGLRRYSQLNLVGDAGVLATTVVSSYQAGCVSITSGKSTVKYRKYSSAGNSVLDHASVVASDPKYTWARATMASVPSYVNAIAHLEHASSATSYAKSVQSVIDTYDLTKYDKVPLNLVLSSGKKGPKVTALQYLLADKGASVKITGSFDSQTVAAVKWFQKANHLNVDGEAGPNTLSKLKTSVTLGSTGSRAYAIKTLLAAAGYPAESGSKVESTTYASLKAFQARNGIRQGSTNTDTWWRLFMILDAAPTPTIKGTTTVGQTLSVTPGSWGSRVETAYQWYRNGVAISGATGTSYKLQPADAQKSIVAAVTGFRPTYTSVTRGSATTAPITPARLTSTPTPKINGVTAVGRTLSVATGSWAPTPVTLRYQWYRNGTAITKATGYRYRLQSADYGARITVRVTGSKAGYYSAAKTSAASNAVAKGTISKPPTPKISGTVKIGRTVTAVVGTWSPKPANLRYQWYRDGKAIPNATAASYKIRTSDAGRVLKVRVTSSDKAYNTVSVYSAQTGKVRNLGWKTKGKVSITGVARSGHRLSATVSTFSPTPTLSYQWYRNGTAITGATKATYKLSKADRHATVTVKVRAQHSGYATVVRTAKVKVA